jgi:hypothetical protein
MGDINKVMMGVVKNREFEGIFTSERQLLMDHIPMN